MSVNPWEAPESFPTHLKKAYEDIRKQDHAYGNYLVRAIFGRIQLEDIPTAAQEAAMVLIIGALAQGISVAVKDALVGYINPYRNKDTVTYVNALFSEYPEEVAIVRRTQMLLKLTGKYNQDDMDLPF